MADRARRLVVGFGSPPGWAVTRDLVNYDIKRRCGVWESAFVGVAGRVQHVIVAGSHDEALALRDYLNEQPTSSVRRVTSERGLPGSHIEAIRAVLELAWSVHEADGEPPKALGDLVWTIVDAELERVEELRALILAATPVKASRQARWADFTDFPFSAVIFDLDQTLVDSSQLSTPAARSVWADQGRDEGKVRPLEVAGSVAAHDLPMLLAERNIPVGIATRSPQRYAERVLHEFGVYADVVRAGTGSKVASILGCTRTLGVSPKEAVVLGDDASDILAAREVGAQSLGAVWTPERWPDRLQPDIACGEPELLMRVADWTRLGFLAEQPATADPHVHPESWIPCGGSGTFALGRYFPSGSTRHSDSLSRAVLAGKATPQPDPVIERAVMLAGSLLGERSPVDLVTSVPSSNGQVDRFSRYRRIAANAFDADAVEALGIVRPIGGYKHLSHTARRAASHGRFRADPAVAGQHVLIIDDVVTSGATFASCEVALRDAGATDVFSLAFATTQD